MTAYAFRELTGDSCNLCFLFAGGEAEEKGVVGECQGLARHRPRPSHRRTRYSHHDNFTERVLGGRGNLFARDGCRRRRRRGGRQRDRDASFSTFTMQFRCATHSKHFTQPNSKFNINGKGSMWNHISAGGGATTAAASGAAAPKVATPAPPAAPGGQAPSTQAPKQ